MDVRHAYFYAKAKRQIYMETPKEMQDGEVRQCGRLRRAMYEARDAASAWQDEYEDTLKKCGFIQGLASPYHFRHENGANIVVHGDDFLILDRRSVVDKTEQEMSQKYFVEVQRMGRRRTECQQMRVLNRVTAWEVHGISIESDTKHADLPLQVSCMGTRRLSTAEALQYRADAEIMTPLSADRPGLHLAATEVSRHMSQPHRACQERLGRSPE